MAQSNSDTVEWWGRAEVPLGRCCRWQIGPLSLYIQRLSGEWRITRSSSSDPMAISVECAVPGEPPDISASAHVSRFGVGGTNESLHLVPALADRHVVSSPQLPFYIPAGESVTVFVAHPLWLQVMSGSDRTLLDEFAMHQPPDTWFGPDTKTGKLCYAARSFCQLRLDDVHDRPHRATTSILIKNRASTELYLERIKLPVPLLSLYADPNSDCLWTEDIVLERLSADDLAPLQVRAGAPAALSKAKKVAEPRHETQGNIMVRAFGSLFSTKAEF